MTTRGTGCTSRAISIGFPVPLSPARDPSAMVAIYNLMLAPVPPRTNATYDYQRDRVHFSRDLDRIPGSSLAGTRSQRDGGHLQSDAGARAAAHERDV